MKKLLLLSLSVLLTACGAKGAETDTQNPSQPGASAEASSAPTASPSSPEVEITSSDEPIDYSSPDSWCMYGFGAEEAQADVFMIPATVYEEPAGNIVLNADTVRRMQAIDNRMEGMVTDYCQIYSPAYRQMTLSAYVSENYDQFREYAYKDIQDAFLWYWENIHQEGTPVIFFGYSQGADLSLQLLEDYFSGEDEASKAKRDMLIAAYLIGWGTTESVYDQYPNLKPAQSRDDIGVIISFDAEAPEVTDSLILKDGETYVTINPLNWKTDSTRADKSENLGAVLTNAKGEIKFEQAEFCGCYIDESPRHAIKIDDISTKDYPNQFPILPEGSFHQYDITFFYRNLQQNVADRVSSWLSQHP